MLPEDLEPGDLVWFRGTWRGMTGSKRDPAVYVGVHPRHPDRAMISWDGGYLASLEPEIEESAKSLGVDRIWTAPFNILLKIKKWRER